MDTLKNFFIHGCSVDGKKPFLLEVRSSTWFITCTVCTAVFVDIFLYAVIVPVFPFYLVELGVEEKDVQHWLSILLSVYGAALLLSAPLCGYLSDIVTFRRTPLLLGMLSLAGSTVLLCLARSLALLVAGRALQGASAGVVWVVGLALLADTVGKDKAGQAMGFVAVAYSAAALLGPLLGGIVYNLSGYYSVFGMAFGMMGLDICLRLLLIEKKAAKRWVDVDSNSSALANSIVPTLPEKLANSDTISPVVVSAMNGETAKLEQRLTQAKRRLPPMLILLKSRRMQATFWASTVAAMTLTAFDTTLPLFVEQNFDWNSLGAGLVFLAPLAPSFIQPVYGWMVDKYGPRYITFTGLVLCIPPWVLLRIITHDSIAQKILFCFFLSLIGFGVALVLAAVMTEFTCICAEKEARTPGSMGKGGAYAQSYGLFNVSWAVGSLVGAYWSGGIKAKAGWATMTWTFALLCGVMSIPSLLYVGGWIGRAKETRKPVGQGGVASSRQNSQIYTA